MLSVNLDGQFHTHTDDPQRLQELADFAGIEVSRFEIPADELAAFKAQQAREVIRKEVKPLAGDTQSIQGTIADNMGLLMEGLGRFMAVATTSSDPAISTAAQPLADALAPLVAAVDGNTCTLTHHVKGTAQVVTDACTRANAVAGVLEAHANP